MRGNKRSQEELFNFFSISILHIYVAEYLLGPANLSKVRYLVRVY